MFALGPFEMLIMVIVLGTVSLLVALVLGVWRR